MYIKKSLIRIVCSIILGVPFGVFLIWIFSGPRLGFFYDFLMSRRKVPKISTELILIDTAQNSGSANVVDPALIASVLLTLTEVDAGPVVIQTPVLGISPGGAGKDREIITQVTDEFNRIEQNIQNLFQGIRTGSISPLESEQYVGDLIDLIDRGKNRLVYSVSEKELAGVHFFEKAVQIKEHVWMREDSRVAVYQPQAGGETDPQSARTRWYTGYRPDPDGVLRRIAPVIHLEDGNDSSYLMYAAVKDRLDPQIARFTDSGIVFSGMKGRGFENKELLLPLDKNGALLLDGPGKDLGLRRFVLNDFIKYDELDRILFLKLEEMEKLGYYDQLEPEKHPTALYRYAAAMREDLLRDPNTDAVRRWVTSRKNYFDGVDNFFLSGVEARLVTGYEELIASDELDDTIKAQLSSMRDTLIKKFQECRTAYENVSVVRENLETQLNRAFCILGPLGLGQAAWGRGGSGNPGETEASANFANAFLTGDAITPVEDIQVIFWIFIWIFITSFIIRDTNTVLTILAGIIAAALSVVFFSSLFVYRALWINPVIPAGAVLFSSLVSVFMGLIFKRRLTLELRRAYGPYISSAALKKIIKRTGPEPWETITAYTAIVAVRSRSVNTSESKDSPVMAALAVRKFRDEVSQIFKEAGAVIIGSDGDLVLAAFGSPLERSALWNAGIPNQYMNNPDDLGKVNPADKAVSAVTGIMKRKIDIGNWTFGIDCGECAFTYSDASGYSAFGYAVVKARILSGLSHKYQVKIIISENLKEHTGLPIETRRLDTLVERELGTKEAFFELM